ncbi:MAG: Maf family protein [Aestuariivita sp.]|nr:Maf family protein [Aestuariivita sp.]
MNTLIVLASSSPVRINLLRNAGIKFNSIPPYLDEISIKKSMLSEGASALEIADSLAEAKARKISKKREDAFVIGCDQVLEFKGELLSKPINQADAQTCLMKMSGNWHKLFSAIVVFENQKPVWRHIEESRLLMHKISREYLINYIQRNWEHIKHSVGSYCIEEEGIRLFSKLEGDYFSILGLPLLHLLSYMSLRGVISR